MYIEGGTHIINTNTIFQSNSWISFLILFFLPIPLNPYSPIPSILFSFFLMLFSCSYVISPTFAGSPKS